MEAMLWKIYGKFAGKLLIGMETKYNLTHFVVVVDTTKLSIRVGYHFTFIYIRSNEFPSRLSVGFSFHPECVLSVSIQIDNNYLIRHWQENRGNSQKIQKKVGKNIN